VAAEQHDRLVVSHMALGDHDGPDNVPDAGEPGNLHTYRVADAAPRGDTRAVQGMVELISDCSQMPDLTAQFVALAHSEVLPHRAPAGGNQGFDLGQGETGTLAHRNHGKG
jgi:hypothetical protein